MEKTTRDRILSYIENMAPGDRLTVKTIAQELGTGPEMAYQIIREAERQGLLQFRTSSKQEPLVKKNIPAGNSLQDNCVQEPLTLRIIADITEAKICCGEDDLDRRPSKFLVAAMDLRAMANYLVENALCIVGNRTDAQMLVLENKSSLLITGHLFPSTEVLGYAKEIGSAIMVTPYETFITTSLINLALYAEYEKVVFVGGELLPRQRPEEENTEHRFTIDYRFEKASVLTGLIHPWMVNSDKGLKSWIMSHLLEYAQTAFLRDQHNINTYRSESCYLCDIKPAQLGEKIRLTTRMIAKQRDNVTIETEVTGEHGTLHAKSINKYRENRLSHHPSSHLHL